MISRLHTSGFCKNCYICGIPQYNRMFHRKRIGLLVLPYSTIVKEMIRINRRGLHQLKLTKIINKSWYQKYTYN